jgi:phosphatidylglycerophosphate synthase
MAASGTATAAMNAVRVNRSLTATAERRMLIWMAERAPRWVTSDQLTLLGFGAQVTAGVFFAMARLNRLELLMVVACIALNWLGDSLDGTLARVRGQQRPRYGFYVDHMVDVLGAVVLMTGLGFSGFIHWQVALAMLIAFLVLASESYLATNSLGRFVMSQGMFGPTEIRILLIAGCLALLRSPFTELLGRRFLLFDVGGAIATAAMLTMAVVTTARHTAQLYREEPLR